MIDMLMSNSLARATGLAVVEFAWQGAVLGAATWLVLLALRRAGPQARYLIACASLALMVAAPVATALSLYNAETPPESRQVAVWSMSAGTGVTEPSVMPGSGPDISLAASLRGWIDAKLHWITFAWAVGVIAFGLRFAGGWWRLRSIRRSATPLSRGVCVELASALAKRLRLNRRVLLVSSSRVTVPAVVGWLKPAILIPGGMLAGMPAAQLEAILAHELAHIRRGDFLVNLLQCAAELLLFYHPAIWWVSRQIRLERELCADDLAVLVTRDRVTYAGALASLESQRIESVALTMSAGGHLVYRIRRLVAPDALPPSRLSGGVAMTVLTLFLVLALSGAPARSFTETVVVPAVTSPQVVVSEPARPEPPASRPSTTRASARTQAVVPSQAEPGRISGVVRDRDGGTLPGVTVILAASESGGRGSSQPPAQRAVTNPRGEFAFEKLQAAEYDVTASLTGFRTHRSRVRVSADGQVQLAIRLELGMVTEDVTVVSPLAAQVPSRPRSRTAADYFDLAKTYYEQGRLVEAEEMTTLALELLRAETPRATIGVVPAPAGPVRVGGDIVAPKKIRDVKPIYPAEAVAAGTAGIVIIEAAIGRDGTVTSARVVRSVPGLDDAALGAVRQWLYVPTRLNGVPVEVLMTVTVSFVR